MAARARIVDSPYPADAGPGTLMWFGGTSSERTHTTYLLTRFADVETVSLASLRELATRHFRKREKSLGLAEPNDVERLAIGVVRTDSGIFHREYDEPSFSYMCEEQFEELPIDPTVAIEADRVSVYFASFSFDEPDTDSVKARLRPYLSRNAAKAKVTTEFIEWPGPGYRLEVELRRDFPRGATFGDAWHLGDDADTLLQLVEGDEVPRSIALDLIRNGRWGVFKGQPESDWLEAKGAPYQLTKSLGKNWKYELAKDVAAFANSPAGGLIVIGMTTEDEGDGEVITGFKEFDLKRVTAASYGNLIAQHVYPRVEGFEVVRVSGQERGQGIAALVIPPQKSSNLPFLVRGVVQGGDVLGSHILWPVRQGDQTALLDIDGIHSRLRLGDQAIKR